MISWVPATVLNLPPQWQATFAVAHVKAKKPVWAVASFTIFSMTEQDVTSRDNNEFARIMLKFLSVAMGVLPACLRQGAERPKSLPHRLLSLAENSKNKEGDRKGWFSLHLLSSSWGDRALYKQGASSKSSPWLQWNRGTQFLFLAKRQLSAPLPYENSENKASVTDVCVSLVALLSLEAALASLVVSRSVTRYPPLHPVHLCTDL